MPKKKIIRDFEAGKSVPTQELAKASEIEPIELHQDEKPSGLVAYAAFDFAGAHYEPGDVFDPSGLAPAPAFDELRGISLKNAAGDIGKAFDLNGRIVVLPVKEA